MEKTDLIIIGAGPGGYETAIKAAQKKLQVVLIEEKALGGTCLNEGCIPTKCLCRNAEVLDTLHRAGTFGVTSGPIVFEPSAAVRRKNDVVEQLKTGIRSLLDSPHIKMVSGKAYFTDNHTIIVDKECFTAPYIIIATGSENRNLQVPGADDKGILTSREILDLEEIPAHLCIIGGGVIGMEFASIFHTFGSKVTVIEYTREILPAFDRDIARRLRTLMKRRGITFYTGAEVKGIEKQGKRFRVIFKNVAKTEDIECSHVLTAVGRKPRTSGLQLGNTGIAHTPHGITVNTFMQTSVEGVYAIGDVNGICPLAHAAVAQGQCALQHILEKKSDMDLQLIPAAVFTVPEVAAAGLTEEEAKDKGLEYKVLKSFYRANGKALAMDDSEGIVKILADPEGHILGTHIMGAHASDLIHEAALAIHTKATLKDISRMVHVHPSLCEIIHSAVSDN